MTGLAVISTSLAYYAIARGIRRGGIRMMTPMVPSSKG
jgi:drug/metabolite transporter (DMT)-like permease